MSEVIEGYFRAVPPVHSMDSTGFKIVDFDGMGFCFGNFGQWEGKAVRITIEANPELEAQDKAAMEYLVLDAREKGRC